LAQAGLALEVVNLSSLLFRLGSASSPSAMRVKASAIVPVLLPAMIMGHNLFMADNAILTLELQAILDKVTLTYGAGTGVSLGVALPDAVSLRQGHHPHHPPFHPHPFHPHTRRHDRISLSSGDRKSDKTLLTGACLAPNKIPLGTPCVLPTDAFAMGSTAKMYTAAAVLRLVDQGKFNLDDKALPLFDALWTRLNGTSIVNGLGPLIKEVTVRQLLGMSSGIPDFDNHASRQYQFDHPHEDLGPVTEMNFLFPSANFSCKPGTCAQYSSSNYELLGLLLAQQAGKHSWDEYTQAEDLPSFPEMTSTTFAVHGLCSKYTNVHAYSNERTPAVDVYDVSCTNGWTCGNLISNAADAAFFVRALFGKGERILKESTQKEMLKTRPLSGWAAGLPYGLGVMDISVGLGMEPGELVGHGGETYGFNAYTFYSRKWDFGLSVVVNNEDTNITSTALAEAYGAIVKQLNTTGTPPIIV